MLKKTSNVKSSRKSWLRGDEMDAYFAVCSPGLEAFAGAELAQLGVTTGASEGGLTEDAGGVEFTGSIIELYRANLYLRTASRVLVRLGQFYAAAFSELRKKASRLEWEKYLTPGSPISIRVTCKKSRLYHSGAVAERIAGAIEDRLGRAARVEKFDELADSALPQLIIVRLNNDQCTISIDSSGNHLHRRGYRLAVAKAPLRETLAAGIILASGWDLQAALMDPFCGSGTLPIEAAMMAARIAPGLKRGFAFMNWPGFDKTLWDNLLKQAAASIITPPGIIFGSDRDAGAVKMANENAERAGVGQFIHFKQQAVSNIAPPDQPGWIITNPPYGVRVSADKDLRNLYSQIGNVLRAHCHGWHASILCGDLNLLGHTGLRLDSSQRFINGGLSTYLGCGLIE